MKTRTTIAVLLGVGMFLALSPAAQAAIITPSSATATSWIGSSSRDIDSAIDSTGLSGVGDILTQTHSVGSNSSGDYWLGALADNQVLTFTLPSATDVGAVHIWQYDRNNQWNSRGVNTFDISFSTDGTTFPTTITGLPGLVAASQTNPNELPQTIQFAQQSGVTHVKMSNITNFGDPTWNALAEIRFDTEGTTDGDIPEPAVLVTYHDGTASTAPIAQAAGITATNISYESNDAFRTSFGGAGATPAGPTAGAASGSNWRLWRKSAIDSTLSSADDYAEFSFDVGAAAAGMELTTLTFDLAAGAANNAAGGMEVAYEVFTQVNGAGFISRGGALTLTELLGDNERDQFSEVLTGVVDLSGVGTLQLNDTVDIRIALANEDNQGQANIGLFMQGVELKGAAGGPDGDIPEPATMAALGLALAGLGGYVRRRRKLA